MQKLQKMSHIYVLLFVSAEIKRNELKTWMNDGMTDG